METSDSECFESAGEEFYSDEESDKSKAKQSISEKVNKRGEKTIEKRQTCERAKKDDSSFIETDANKDSPNTRGDQNLNKDFPPTRTACWEPGMDYPLEEADQFEPLEPVKLEMKPNQKEFEKPPEIVQCWEDDVNTIPLKSKPSPKRSPSAKPPEIVQCWEDDVNTIPLKSKPSPKQSEYTDPPETVQCWEEDVNTVPVKNESTSLKECNRTKEDQEKTTTLLGDKTKDSEVEENMWENDDWGVDDLTVEPGNTKSEPNPNSEIKSSKKEENMWEDDNWDDFEDTNNPKQPDEINMWEDDWEPIEDIPKSNVQQEPTKDKDTGWGSWGSWGLSSVISTATNITSQVSQSITTVLESGIGVPNPEELARVDREIEKELENLPEEQQEKPALSFDLGSLVQGVTKLVETTGSKVITGGLDTLETIGKKTMEVLQENDPGLKKKRAFLKLNDDKPILSHMLREAKEKAEKENLELEKKHVIKKPNYETLFDDHQGLVHLEALEMLSKQCDIKLSSVLNESNGEALIDIQETMDQIKELCELPEDEEEEAVSADEINEKLETCVKELNVPITYARLISTWNNVESWLENADVNGVDSKEIHQQAIESLAQLTAIAVEQFHKGGELLLVKQHRSTADEADSLVQLTVTLTTLIGLVSAKFSEKLSMIIQNEVDKKEINELITNVFFEAANSSTYIRDAFQLLIPVLQVGAV